MSQTGGRKKSEVLVYGVAACRAIAERRRDDIIRAYVVKELVPEHKELLQWLAAERRAYHVLSRDELEKVCKTTHHEGMAVLTREPTAVAWPEFKDWATQAVAQSQAAGKAAQLIYLDGVANPHNIGAILRTAAHFGLPYLLIDQHGFRRLPGAAYRVAKGGAEYCRLLALTEPVAQLRALQELGWQLAATSPRGESALAPQPQPTVWLLGSEQRGLRPALVKQADRAVTIPGSGQVESLNVSAAAAILLASQA